MDIKHFTTKELVEELSKREGVTEIIAPDPDHRFNVGVIDSDGKPKNEGICGYHGTGPARILVVID